MPDSAWEYPSIETVWVIAGRGLLSVMVQVWVEESKPGTGMASRGSVAAGISKRMSLGDVAASALMIACRNEPVPESLVFVTMNDPDAPESLSLIWRTAIGWKSMALVVAGLGLESVRLTVLEPPTRWGSRICTVNVWVLTPTPKVKIVVTGI